MVLSFEVVEPNIGKPVESAAHSIVILVPLQNLYFAQVSMVVDSPSQSMEECWTKCFFDYQQWRLREIISSSVVGGLWEQIWLLRAADSDSLTTLHHGNMSKLKGSRGMVTLSGLPPKWGYILKDKKQRFPPSLLHIFSCKVHLVVNHRLNDLCQVFGNLGNDAIKTQVDLLPDEGSSSDLIVLG